MNIRVLGAYNCTSVSSRLISLLIDDVVAVDAGAIASGLSFEAQQKIKAILLTHQHYDHVRDIPAIAMNLWLRGTQVTIYSIPEVYNAIITHLLNDKIYPNFYQRPLHNPTLRPGIVEPLQALEIEGYSVLAVPVKHSTPTVGYQVTSHDGKVVFYTGDTGPGLANCWQHISPQLLITEVTAPDRYKEEAIKVGHLTPSLLRQELIGFRDIKGYLPRVLVVHISPHLERETAAEIAVVEKELGSSITLADEGMQINL